MVDLRPKANQEYREFKPAGTVNQNKKKKEKLKAKKIRDRELKALEEQKAREKAMEAARKKTKTSKYGEAQDVITPEGKKLIKKTVPKTKVKDDKGDEWEVVDQRKSVIVEEDTSENNSDLSD